MILEAEAEHIKRLSSTELVQLMKLLLLAEARLADIPLRASTVPMQITVPDGGEDGRVDWTGGARSTDYFPSSFCVFQSKARHITEASVRAEVLKERKKPRTKKARVGTKAQRATKLGPKLSAALQEVVARKGSYIIFCGHPLGAKITKLKEGIRSAIREAGKNPGRLASIEIYDANVISDWVNGHPSVALWLAQHDRKRSLAGFQTHQSWGKSPEIRTGDWIDDNKTRFIGSNVSRSEQEPQGWTFQEAAEAISNHLANDHQCIRIAGPSGFGKSRFAYEVFKRNLSVGDQIDRACVIYADHSIVRDEVPKLAIQVAEGGSACILVVDECPDEMHLKLASYAQRSDSRLRIVTIDVETKVVQAENTLTIRLEPAPKEMISKIAKGVAPQLSDVDTSFIQELSQGFPQMAVLAAQQKADGKQTFRSAEQLLDRIIWGRRTPAPDAQRALETLSLFNWIAISGRYGDQATLIAHDLAGLSKDAFIEAIKSFRVRGIVVQRGSFVQVQPVPLAARLAANRWTMLPDGKLVSFFDSAPLELKESILQRIRWLDDLTETLEFARALLAPGALGNLAALNTDIGAKAVDRLVHVDPDLAMGTIARVFGALSIDELRKVDEGRRHLVWALERLAFRSESFMQAATLLRRFAAAETEDSIANNASGQFKQLYQLHLSGTQAPPSDRLIVLDEGLVSADEQERVVSFAALEQMLDTGHFSRGGGAEEIGSRTRLEDWRPATYGEIWDFYRSAIKRLLSIALDDTDAFAGKAKAALGSHIRGLFRGVPFDDVEALIRAVVAKDGFWPEALQGLNEWLYFDRKGVPPDIVKKVRALFQDLMPTDPVALATLYTHGWHAEFRDPDVEYDRDTNSDFEYATRQAVAQAAVIIVDPVLTEQAVARFATGDAKSPGQFGKRLSELSPDPVKLFNSAVAQAEASTAPANTQFFAGLVAGADGRDPEMARQCVRAALQSEKLKGNAIAMIGANRLQPADLNLVASLLRSGDIQPWQTAPLSYGRGFDHLPAKDIMPLLAELSQHGAAGLWTVLDIVSMYLHGGRTPESGLLRKIKDILLAPQLLTGKSRRNRDGYTLEQMVETLSRHGATTRAFARALAKQVLSICQNEVDRDLFFELDDPVRKVLKGLMSLYPREVWNEIAPLLVSDDWLIRHRIEQLVERTGDNQLGAGLLGALPSEFYLDWVRRDPKRRAAVAMHWVPVADKAVDGTLSWHSELESFVNKFGEQDGVLGQLAIRLYPRSWWGSIGPQLEPLLPLLQGWSAHPSPTVRRWVQDFRLHLRKEIADAARRSEEDDVRFS